MKGTLKTRTGALLAAALLAFPMGVQAEEALWASMPMEGSTMETAEEQETVYNSVSTHWNGTLAQPTAIKVGQEKATGFDTSSWQRTKGLYSYYGRDVWNWAQPQTMEYFVDADGRLNSASYENGQLVIRTRWSNGNLAQKRVLDLPLPLWGGFYAAPDGYYYVVVGQDNPDERSDRMVLQVLQYDANWTLCGTASFTGGYTNTFQGIFVPMDASSLEMAWQDGVLTIVTGRTMWIHDDGLHHQSNVTFKVNTRTMAPISEQSFAQPYVSHSFRQLVCTDDEATYYADHGDAYPRAVRVTRVDGGPKGNERTEANVLNIPGATGDNETGLTLDGMVLMDDTLLLTGLAVRDGNLGVTGQNNDRYDVYLTVLDTDLQQAEHYWVTEHNGATISEPRLVAVNDEQTALLYTATKGDNMTTTMLLLDEDGRATARYEYPNLALDNQSEPIVYQGAVTWLVDAQNGDDGMLYWANLPLDGKVATYPEEGYGSGVEGFVRRLYGVCLGRKPDTAGFNNWVNELRSGRISGTQAASGFVFSEEFKSKNYCNDDYVKQLYRAFMGREFDEGGLKHWVSELESGKTREEVFNGFAMSNEFGELCSKYGIQRGTAYAVPQYGTVPHGACSVCGAQDGVTAFVTRLYEVCLDRKPDAAGLNDWSKQLWDHSNTGRGVASGFIFSKEFTGKGYDDATYVEYLYKAFFGRASDAPGKADWLNRMAKGMTRQQVFDGFVGSKEFNDLCNRYGITRG